MYPITYKKSPKLLLGKKVVDKRIFVFLGIVVLIVLAVFWQKELLVLGEQVMDFLVWGEARIKVLLSEVNQVLTSQKEIFLSGIGFHSEGPLDLTEEPEGISEITLPAMIEETVLEEEILAGEPIIGIRPFLEEEPFSEEETLIILPKKEKCDLSLSDIEEQVEEISEKVEVISIEVAELVEASGKEQIAEESPLAQAAQETENESQLAEIEEQINGISAKIEVVSQQIAELVKA